MATEERTEGTKLLRLKGNDLFCTIFLHSLRFFQRTHEPIEQAEHPY